MPDDMLSNSRITAAFREKTPGSAALAKEAGSLFPSGITHDSRYIEPYGVYIERVRAAQMGRRRQPLRRFLRVMAR